MKQSLKCLKNRRLYQEIVKIFIQNLKSNRSLIHQQILIELSKVKLMDKKTLLDQPIPSKDYKCIEWKLQTWLKCIKGQLKPQELILTENGLAMSELLTKKHLKSWESKWPKSNKIQLKFLLNQKKYQPLFSKTQQNKIKFDYLRFKHINKHLAHKVVEKKLNLTLQIYNKWLKELKIKVMITKKILT